MNTTNVESDTESEDEGYATDDDAPHHLEEDAAWEAEEALENSFFRWLFSMTLQDPLFSFLCACLVALLAFMAYLLVGARGLFR